MESEATVLKQISIHCPLGQEVTAQGKFVATIALPFASPARRAQRGGQRNVPFRAPTPPPPQAPAFCGVVLQSHSVEYARVFIQHFRDQIHPPRSLTTCRVFPPPFHRSFRDGNSSFVNDRKDQSEACTEPRLPHCAGCPYDHHCRGYACVETEQGGENELAMPLRRIVHLHLASIQYCIPGGQQRGRIGSEDTPRCWNSGCC